MKAIQNLFIVLLLCLGVSECGPGTHAMNSSTPDHEPTDAQVVSDGYTSVNTGLVMHGTKTSLASIDIEPGHIVEFLEVEPGVVLISERGRLHEQPPVVTPNMADQPLPDVYRALAHAGTIVPTVLLAAEARRSSLVTAKEVTRPEIDRVFDTGTHVITKEKQGTLYSALTSEQQWFTSSFCGSPRTCIQGWDWAYIVTNRVNYWKTTALVGSEGSKPAQFHGYWWKCTGTCGWAPLFNYELSPGYYQSVTSDNRNAAFWFKSSIDGAGGETQVSLASDTSVISRFCIQHDRVSPSTGYLNDGTVCSQDGHESDQLNLGDDTKWINQRLAFTYQGDGQVCMRFHALGSAGWTETDWSCSHDGQMSSWIPLGDDSGWSNQALQIRSSSSKKVCFRHRRLGSNNRYSQTGLVCSVNNNPSDWSWIGDDSGYKKQQMSIAINPPPDPPPRIPEKYDGCGVYDTPCCTDPAVYLNQCNAPMQCVNVAWDKLFGGFEERCRYVSGSDWSGWSPPINDPNNFCVRAHAGRCTNTTDGSESILSHSLCADACASTLDKAEQLATSSLAVQTCLGESWGCCEYSVDHDFNDCGK